jgi:opacity protein-like surface antigen
LVLAYQDNFTTGNVTVKKDIMPASGRNGAADRTVVAFDLRQRFTYELQGFVTGGYYLNKSDPGEYAIYEIDERTMRGGAGLRYEFTRDMYLEASYEYIKTQYRSSDTQADRNLCLLRFFMQHAFFER